MSAFSFPKLPKPHSERSHKQCVTKVNITWEDLVFRFSLTPLRLEQVVPAIKEVLHGLCSVVGSSHPSPSSARVPMRLSDSELGIFGNGAIQCNSNASILVDVGVFIYKIPQKDDFSYHLNKVCIVCHIPCSISVCNMLRFLKFSGRSMNCLLL